MSIQNKKLENLKSILLSYKKVAIAYSGGMDSSFLAILAKQIIPESSILIFVQSEFISENECNHALDTAKRIDANLKIINKSVLDNKKIVSNPLDRCYYCKKEIFTTILSEIGQNYVLCDGSVIDDDNDFRPGKRALKELGVKSPLKDAGISKSFIREELKKWGFEDIARPPQSCLATRISTDELITKEKLHQIEQCETILRDAGLANHRCRHHNNILRIEISQTFEDAIKIIQKCVFQLKATGFKHVTVDMEKYGSVKTPY